MCSLFPVSCFFVSLCSFIDNNVSYLFQGVRQLLSRATETKKQCTKRQEAKAKNKKQRARYR